VWNCVNIYSRIVPLYIHIYFRYLLRDRITIYSVFKDSYLRMCNESDLEHFSFVVNIVVNVFVETVPRKYSCVLLDWKIQTYVMCMQECGRW